MIRSSLLVLAAAALVTGAGALEAQQPAPAGTLTLDRARAIALAKVPDNQGVESAKLKTRDGVLVWEFDIETPGSGHQEVRVDAHTGAIVYSKHEDDLVGTAVNKAEGAAKEARKEAEKAGREAEKTGKEAAKKADRVFSKEDIEKMHPAISEEHAVAIAKHAVPGAPVKDVDLETEDGVLVWEIDLDTAPSGHEEVLVNANSGKVLRKRHED